MERISRHAHHFILRRITPGPFLFLLSGHYSKHACILYFHTHTPLRFMIPTFFKSTLQPRCLHLVPCALHLLVSYPSIHPIHSSQPNERTSLCHFSEALAWRATYIHTLPLTLGLPFISQKRSCSRRGHGLCHSRHVEFSKWKWKSKHCMHGLTHS